MAIAADAGGTLYILERGKGRVRKVTPDGIITTAVSQAALSNPDDLALDQFGNLYIADTGNDRIRKFNPVTGLVPVVAATIFNHPEGLAVDASGNVYVADSMNSRVRKISVDGAIATVAGNSVIGYSGDGGDPAAAQLSLPFGVAVDAAGNLYIADAGNNRIRKVTFPIGAQQQYILAPRGAMSLTAAESSSLKVGYSAARASSGSPAPAGFAVFSLRQNGVLVSEASVPGSQPLTSGRIYTELSPFVRTGIAIANPNPTRADISFYFTDDQGQDFGTGTIQVDANGQVSRFLDEAPFNLTNTKARTFTFSSSVPVAMIALRGLTNERAEFLVTTLPVAPLSSFTTGDFVFPHYANGDGWTTQIVLVNPTDQLMTGVIGGETPYSIKPRSATALAIGGTRSTTATGAIRVSPNGTSPSGFLIFSYRANGVTVTEASVPASPIGSAFRMYAEPGSGIAVANSGGSTVAVTFELTTLAGDVVATATRSLAPNAHLAVFLKEFSEFSRIPLMFRGLLRVTGTSISVLGLRGRYNEREDFLITTTPAVPESVSTGSDLIFPHVVQGGGYTTEMILFSRTPASSAGSLEFIWR